MTAQQQKPQFHSLGEVVTWVIEDLGAMCPSLERLEKYCRTPDAPEFSDIRYHVGEAGCHLCGEDLSATGQT